MRAPRVGGTDDFVDTRLIEAFIAIVALQDFEVRSERTAVAKTICLFFRNRANRKGRIRATRFDLPRLGLGKSLLEKGEIGEWRHDAKSGLLDLLARGVKVEAALEVMHSGVKKRFAMQQAP